MPVRGPICTARSSGRGHVRTARKRRRRRLHTAPDLGGPAHRHHLNALGGRGKRFPHDLRPAQDVCSPRVRRQLSVRRSVGGHAATSLQPRAAPRHGLGIHHGVSRRRDGSEPGAGRSEADAGSDVGGGAGTRARRLRRGGALPGSGWEPSCVHGRELGHGCRSGIVWGSREWRRRCEPGDAGRRCGLGDGKRPRSRWPRGTGGVRGDGDTGPQGRAVLASPTKLQAVRPGRGATTG